MILTKCDINASRTAYHQKIRPSAKYIKSWPYKSSVLFNLLDFLPFFYSSLEIG